jgi:hypothetical protein
VDRVRVFETPPDITAEAERIKRNALKRERIAKARGARGRDRRKTPRPY